MKNKIVYRFFLIIILFVAAASGFGAYADFVAQRLPEEIYVQNDCETTVEFGLPATAEDGKQKINLGRPATFITGQTGNYKLLVKLFGIFDIATVDVNVVEQDFVYPCGFQIGLYLKTDGVLIADTQDIIDIYGNEVSPCKSILRKGDYILAVNGQLVSSKNILVDEIKKCGGTEVVFTIRRNGEEFDVSIMPAMDESGIYKAGLWVKDDAQGIGTMTYIDGKGGFGALGHGISDETSKSLLELKQGRLYKTKIVSIIKGTNGTPGEFVGTIDYQEKNLLGTIEKNTSGGIFGKLKTDLISEYNLECMEVGYSHEIAKGKAYIRMYTGMDYNDYEINIEHISYNSQKNMTFTVKSQELLEITNGIVQGMSGSPIIQNGKVIGAVTHVLVDDSTKGYGIFIENMLEH